MGNIHILKIYIVRMNLFLNKKYWVFELFLIILFFSLINVTVILIRYDNVYTIITCQLINLTGFIVLLLVSRKHIIAITEKAGYKWLGFLNEKILLADILLILVITILSKIASGLMMRIKILDFFNISLFKGFYVNHLSVFEKSVFILIVIIVLIIGVFAEEFYFRRYLFEIQSVYFKGYTWIINGFSWSIYHVFSPTNFLVILPTCLLYAYVYQKRKNIWIIIIAHLINNITAVYPVLKANL